jgi:hypothetical protein
MIRNTGSSVLLALFLVTLSAAGRAEDCADFKWDVTSERALFAAAATPLPAGAEQKSAPSVLLNHLYALKLMPQEQVTFAVSPGKKTPSPGSHAGIVTFKLPASGSYRIAIDMPFWIDVVSDGALVAARDFEGQHGCSAPHKIVEFELTGTRPFFLQLSNAAPDSVRLTITAAPARKL